MVLAKTELTFRLGLAIYVLADYWLSKVHLQRFLLAAHTKGVPVALGTDTPFPHHVPGFAGPCDRTVWSTIHLCIDLLA